MMVVVVMVIRAMQMEINPFHGTGLLLHPLKTSKNQRFSVFSGGIERDQWHKMGRDVKHKMATH